MACAPTPVPSSPAACSPPAERSNAQPPPKPPGPEVPLAAPTILAGIRIAVVATIGTATIAAVIGGGGLGVLIFRGVASVDVVSILAGAIPAALLALLADAGLGILERASKRR